MSKRWNIEHSFFKGKIQGYNPHKPQEQYEWPYEPQAEINYKHWLAKVQDKQTKSFYKKRETVYEYDNEGKPIPGSDKVVEKEPYFERSQIVRIRTKDGKEFLYSRGKLFGYDVLGNLQDHPFQEPEIYLEHLFRTRNEPDKRNPGQLITICEGTIGAIKHYTIPFTLDAKGAATIDELMKDARPDVGLIVCEENGRVKQAKDLEMFKTKSFDYIMNDEAYTAEQREQARKEFEAIQNNVISKRGKT